MALSEPAPSPSSPSKGLSVLRSERGPEPPTHAGEMALIDKELRARPWMRVLSAGWGEQAGTPTFVLSLVPVELNTFLAWINDVARRLDRFDLEPEVSYLPSIVEDRHEQGTFVVCLRCHAYPQSYVVLGSLMGALSAYPV